LKASDIKTGTGKFLEVFKVVCNQQKIARLIEREKVGKCCTDNSRREQFGASKALDV